MFDIVITGGTVVDGSGSLGYPTDVGIEGERVTAIGDLGASQASRTVDAAGLTVAPGFIDTHTHSEGPLLVDPQHACGLRQGITTELLGLDGMSFAPLSAENYRVYRRYLGGLLGDPPDDLDMGSVEAFRSHYHRKVAVNTAYLVPHGTIRLEALGFSDQPLIGGPLARATVLLREGIEQGAVGFSTGSKYYPGPWADTAELIELCNVLRDSGGVYVTEVRTANLDRAFGGSGVEEAFEIARQSGVPVHLAHYRTSAETVGGVAELMEPVDKAEADGIDCSLDIYPYPTGSSIPVSFLPSYVQDGGPVAIMRTLKDPDERRRIGHHLDNDYPMSMEEVRLSYLPNNRPLEGMSLRDIAEQRGTSMGVTLCDLLLEEDLKVGYVGIPPASAELRHQISTDSLELLSRHDYMVCSDITPLGGLPHPRCFGAFPRFLGRLRREFGTLSLEQMVHRMTERPARRFGLPKRGLIEKGYYADVVVFDADRINDSSTYDDPRRYPAGVHFVLVNGQVAVDDEECTGVLAGQAVP